jgi:lipopolysaccharide transport system ATP-binding protein
MLPVIEATHLSKAYRLGQIGSGTLVEDLNRWWARVRGVPQPKLKIGAKDQALRPGEILWALSDLSFRVEPGEVLGIIGRNGSGKSTLLKILSRLTAPTTGEVRIKGRLAGLLEVGTGFHPDLTGRENVFLNGAILGMTQKEITRKFDEIVAFAAVEPFIDTPVKRYSSGMYVRLAFAVAAHLEPEILIVDEVLAVGDGAFQNKCLGKMQEAGRSGRTVLFVSHNLQAVQALCRRVVQLEQGRIVNDGEPRRVTASYLAALCSRESEKVWSPEEAPGNDDFRLTALRVLPRDAQAPRFFSTREELRIQMHFVCRRPHPGLCVGFDILTAEGETVLRSYQTDQAPAGWPEIRTGPNHWECLLPAGMLNAGLYYVCPRVGVHNLYWIVHLEPSVQFELTLDHGVSPFWNSLDGSSRPGCLAPILDWQALTVQ